MNLTKVSNGLVSLEVEETLNEKLSERSENLVASITCPYCSKCIGVAHSSAERPSGIVSQPWWNTSNFDSHLKKHQNCFDVEQESGAFEVLGEYQNSFTVKIV